MRWEDEHWVKLYTRDTLDWQALGWEAHAVWHEVFRKLDTAGVLDLGKRGPKGFAVAIGMPEDVFDRGLRNLLEDGCLVLNRNLLVMPNYVEAQAARKSDRQRQRDSRSRARDLAMSQHVTVPEGSVTKRDEMSREPSSCHDDESLSHVSSATSAEEKRGEEKRSSLSVLPTSVADPDPNARARSTQRARIRPRIADDLIFCMRVAIQREQPVNGMWNPGKFATKDADEFLRGFGDALEEALETIERRIEIFAKDATMSPWTVDKFVRAYNGLETPKLQANGKPAPMQARY